MIFESQVLDIIEGKKSAPITKGLLNVMSQCYHAGVSLRNFAYDQKIVASIKLPLPVVSIGNIVAGGTGKTPFTHYLAKSLQNFSKVAVLSRGYRRKSKGLCLLDEFSTVDEAGDEPCLLFQKLPKAKIIACRNRIRAANFAIHLKSDILILDDGMQHRQLDRDIEIGVMHADDLFGKGFYLPRGLLRDSPSRLRAADLIILSGIKDEEHFAQTEKTLREYTDSPVTAMQLVVENSSEIASKKVAAFCGIASPERFFETLKEHGCETVIKETKLDHVAFTEDELVRLSNRAEQMSAECLVCTEKDAVKLPKTRHVTLPIIPLEIGLLPTFGKDNLEQLIQKIKEDIDERRF